MKTLGILRLYVTLLRCLAAQPDNATQKSLDEIAGGYGDFAYIGSRRTLQSIVLEQAGLFHQRLQKFDKRFYEEAAQKQPILSKRLTVCRDNSDSRKVAAAWYGRGDWAKDSGVFPDFVLALDDLETFGNGAIVELKDSNGSNIASFNSTIPTRFKSLIEVQAIMGSRMVVEAAWLRDFPQSLAEDYLSKERHCFYLIRTHRRLQERVRISLVEGSFFETIPKSELIQRVWEQILKEIGVSEEQKQQLLPLLAQLEQSMIAHSRHIEGASVKPRFRIMAEVESDANLHAYPEVKPRTVNLVIKREQYHNWTWLRENFATDGIEVKITPEGDKAKLVIADSLLIRCFSIWHKRNGEHWCLQWQLPQ